MEIERATEEERRRSHTSQEQEQDHSAIKPCNEARNKKTVEMLPVSAVTSERDWEAEEPRRSSRNRFVALEKSFASKGFDIYGRPSSLKENGGAGTGGGTGSDGPTEDYLDSAERGDSSAYQQSVLGIGYGPDGPYMLGESKVVVYEEADGLHPYTAPEGMDTQQLVEEGNAADEEEGEGGGNEEDGEEYQLIGMDSSEAAAALVSLGTATSSTVRAIAGPLDVSLTRDSNSPMVIDDTDCMDGAEYAEQQGEGGEKGEEKKDLHGDFPTHTIDDNEATHSPRNTGDFGLVDGMSPTINEMDGIFSMESLNRLDIDYDTVTGCVSVGTLNNSNNNNNNNSGSLSNVESNGTVKNALLVEGRDQEGTVSSTDDTAPLSDVRIYPESQSSYITPHKKCSYILLKKLKKSAWKGSVVCLTSDETAVGRVVLVEKGKEGRVHVRGLTGAVVAVDARQLSVINGATEEYDEFEDAEVEMLEVMTFLSDGGFSTSDTTSTSTSTSHSLTDAAARECEDVLAEGDNDLHIDVDSDRIGTSSVRGDTAPSTLRDHRAKDAVSTEIDRSKDGAEGGESHC